MNIYKKVKTIILDVFHQEFKKLDTKLEENITCEQPKNQKFGDISTNIILVVHKEINIEKKKIFETLMPGLSKNKIFEDLFFIEPGFVNFKLSKVYWTKFLEDIYLIKNNYGFANLGNNKNINIEFVSANPTGPLHIGHLRGAVFGDVLARLLSKTGYKITKEYYVNDLGVQIENLALTVKHHIKNYLEKKERPLTENMYQGDYLKDTALNIIKSKSFNYDDIDKLKEASVILNLDLIKKDLKNLGVIFDNYVSEKEIHRKGLLKKILEKLNKTNNTYLGVLEKPKGKENINWQSEKQLLFKATSFGDRSDRVIKKSNGEWTYFASDIAYHYDKAKRKYDEIINVWGADHGGYVARVKASLEALGFKKILFTVKLCQIVNLIDKKKVIKMSKRKGNFVLVSDILPKIGKDVLRFYMLTRKNDAHLDFDLEKCLAESNENPSFYVQYAYARIQSLKRIAKEKKVELSNKNEKIQILDTIPEINLIKTLSLWPKIIEESVTNREPHRIVYYLIDLSGKFHSYWSLGKIDKKYKILANEDTELTQARLLLLEMIACVIKSGLGILSVSVKDRM